MLDAITVLARAPEPGRAKTRLAAAIGDARAAALHEAMALDVVAAVQAWCRLRRASLTLALTGAAAPVRRFALAAGPGIAVEPQPEGDLGLRMVTALRRRRADGALRVAVVGTDCLDVALAADDAGALLDAADVALVPATDGGFVLMAAACDLDEDALSGVGWGAADTLARTAEALARRALRVARAEGALSDVDDLASLRRLASRLRRHRLPEAPRTRALLASLALPA